MHFKTLQALPFSLCFYMLKIKQMSFFSILIWITLALTVVAIIFHFYFRNEGQDHRQPFKADRKRKR